MSKKTEKEPMQKNFPFDLYKHGIKVVFGDYESLKKFLKKDGFLEDLDEVKNLMDKSAGVTFSLSTDDIVIWMREKPNDDGSMATLAHEIYHAVSFLLRSVGIEHTSDTEEAYAYAFEHLYFRITSWACS